MTSGFASSGFCVFGCLLQLRRRFRPCREVDQAVDSSETLLEAAEDQANNHELVHPRP